MKSETISTGCAVNLTKYTRFSLLAHIKARWLRRLEYSLNLSWMSRTSISIFIMRGFTFLSSSSFVLFIHSFASSCRNRGGSISFTKAPKRVGWGFFLLFFHFPPSKSSGKPTWQKQTFLLLHSFPKEQGFLPPPKKSFP